MKIKHYLLTPLLIASMAIFSERTFAFDFKFGSDETVLLNDDFDSQGNWQLPSNVRIDSGYLIPDADFQTASLNLVDLGIGSLSPSNGAINLYWSAIFPEGAKQERNAYIPALEYAENPLFCWNGKGDDDAEIILGEDGSPCPTGFNKVKENAELRAWMRPQERGKPGFTRLYADPDFTPGVEPEQRDSSEFAFMKLDSQNNSVTDYRMRVEEIDQQVEVELFFLNNGEWDLIGDPLVVNSSQWRYVTGQNEETGDYIYGVEESVSFESINILLRRDTRREPTKIDAIALTQENIYDSKSVPEPISIFSILGVGALGIGRVEKGKNKFKKLFNN
ncbi:MAG: hypothetical protein F6K23_28365 [Okeania sp. SIO2C9]|uniref:hypothetical protein n=1 Tax=Okeania sp. SIO2C9 TaxID=2607791 RepID=UPI0013C10FEE|nr:hypothetical protein [Okeania sp. SIO2C9]NEQ76607.1 hypothetical protein [Okeania sp. SIO2C9]